MPCTGVRLPGGGSAIVCGPRGKAKKCKTCGTRADFLCDWKVPERSSGTCDEPVCGGCKVSPAKDKDLCPTHARAFREWQRTRGQ